MIINFLILISGLFLLLKSSNLAIRYSTKLAESLNLSKYIVGFLIVAIISILPEAFISVTSAIKNISPLGLGTLFGSNIADLTIVFALVVFVSGKSLKIQSKIIKNSFFYIGTLIIPVILGLDGRYSRVEGIVLIIVGLLFYFIVIKNNTQDVKIEKKHFFIKDGLLLLLSMLGLLLGSFLTVEYAQALANNLNITISIVGMFIVGIGTVLPELLFSIKAAKNNHDELALGDLLGTVIADATILVGLMAIINPFSFNEKIIYISGLFMVIAISVLFYFMKSEKLLTKKETLILVAIYILFVYLELFVNNLITK